MNLHRRTLMQMAGAALLAPIGAPHVARAAVRKLRMGHNNSTTSALQAAGVAFQKYIAEKSEGRYEVEVYPAAQLGGDVQQVAAVADGTLDMTVSGIAVLGTYHKDLELIEIPYMFSSIASARKALDGNLGTYYAELTRKNSIVMIGWGESGFRHITANRPIRKVSDLKDLKIRVQPAKIHIESFAGLGAKPAPLNFSELSEALRTGLFEAQENPLGVISSNEFLYKGQSHLSLTSHVYSPFPVMFSADVLDDMSPADREMIKAGGAVAAKATRDFADAAVTQGIERVTAAGMQVVTDVDIPAFQKAMDGMNDRIAAIVGADAIGRVRGLIA